MWRMHYLLFCFFFFSFVSDLFFLAHSLIYLMLVFQFTSLDPDYQNVFFCLCVCLLFLELFSSPFYFRVEA